MILSQLISSILQIIFIICISFFLHRPPPFSKISIFFIQFELEFVQMKSKCKDIFRTCDQEMSPLVLPLDIGSCEHAHVNILFCHFEFDADFAKCVNKQINESRVLDELFDFPVDKPFEFRHYVTGR